MKNSLYLCARKNRGKDTVKQQSSKTGEIIFATRE